MLRGVDLITGLRLVGLPESKTALHRPALVETTSGAVQVHPIAFVGESPYDIETHAILATYECKDPRVIEAYLRAFTLKELP